MCMRTFGSNRPPGLLPAADGDRDLERVFVCAGEGGGVIILVSHHLRGSINLMVCQGH